ncbi:MAG: UDP-N-acetylmuramoyl-L-alanine--D-glutamate ligase, partial [Candidatus Omnitrophica bacterium]|nr:UDP-N-acetylmuramoyl-L-alanine--D-glutamate ligase [Candidatus Omnitrophota bacterium]
KIPVIGELELGARFCRGRIVAVTGSNGKSTVTALVGEMLKAAGRPVVVAGNIGTPLTSVLDQIHPSTTVALEVSSFQLEAIEKFHPSIASVLNVTPNHMDRHENMDAYIAAKRRLLTRQGMRDWAVLNSDDAVCRSYRSSVRGRCLEFSLEGPVRGAYLAGETLCLMLRGRLHRVIHQSDLKLKGRHNAANALAALAIGGLLGLEVEPMQEALQTFAGLEHRMEPVASWNGILFVNDSKSTTVEAGIKALEACPGQAVLIAGGKDKGSDFSKLIAVARDKVRATVLIGADGPRIAAALERTVPVYPAQTLQEAVSRAVQLSRPGDWVLLSPMCASFDMFRDFEDRGEAFKQSVHAFVELENRTMASIG